MRSPWKGTHSRCKGTRSCINTSRIHDVPLLEKNYREDLIDHVTARRGRHDSSRSLPRQWQLAWTASHRSCRRARRRGQRGRIRTRLLRSVCLLPRASKGSTWRAARFAAPRRASASASSTAIITGRSYSAWARIATSGRPVRRARRAARRSIERHCQLTETLRCSSALPPHR